MTKYGKAAGQYLPSSKFGVLFFKCYIPWGSE